MAIKHATPVTVSLSALQSNSIPFSTLLEAFGPSSLGILVVTDLPREFTTLRTTVLSNASRLAALPAPTLERLTNAPAKYLVGWSHGKESLREGVVDDKKGSYYINCSFYNQRSEREGGDGEDASLKLDRENFPGFDEYTAPSVWPAEDEVPGFRGSGQDLIRLIIDTAVLVARACDRYAEQEIEGYEPGYLERVVQGSRTSKARLLHYFPSEEQEEEKKEPGLETAEGKVDDTWCTTHLDHGCLTGLTSAMFVDESSSSSPTQDLAELPTSPDPTSGLYILSRTGEINKVAIPRDSLAFQTGETLQLITQGRFKAVPHFVKGVEKANVADPNARIARNTLAVFTQPNLDEVVDLKTGLTFGEFARGVVKKNTTVAA
ncbi:hypothetical protein LTR84_011516 [Exophiala bonariae]|uniref:Clavaminate synthase-like protein n=1 Tax=Exophiala bonariae TaxID=1690606 RepID=A0AAV9NIN2_9EURO|nr:hypothetical protein LTR84_011516 [Exophiala bonariae]